MWPKRSLIGKGQHSEEHPLGFYSACDHIKAWGGMGAAFSQLDVNQKHAIRYEAALKVDTYVLMVHGTDAEVAQAHAVLSKADSWKAA